MKRPIGIHIGSSFLEASQNQKHQRIYFPKLGFKPSLKQLLQNFKITEDTEIIVSLEYLEKIFSTRLGGSVSQLVTQGFEDYLLVKEASYKSPSHLGNPDLIFPVNERILADGTIHTILNLEDLEFIESKFSMMEVKKVAIHFLHAKTNPTHQNQVAEYFKSKGYDVFVPNTSSTLDEGCLWHRNLLNASLMGSFEEIKKELTEVLQEQTPPPKLFFLNGKGQIFQETPSQIAATLLGSYSNLKRNADEQSANSDVLYLGLQKFFFIPQKIKMTSKLQSPWGPIELEHPEIKALTFNITSRLQIDEFHEISIEKKLGDFDPGPICFGRGLNLSLLDLWLYELDPLQIEGLQGHIKSQLSSKITNTLMVLAKMAEKQEYSPSELSQSLKAQVVEEIWIQIAPYLNSESFLIAGPLAPLFADFFKAFSKKIKVSDFDFWESSNPEFISTPKSAALQGKALQ